MAVDQEVLVQTLVDRRVVGDIILARKFADQVEAAGHHHELLPQITQDIGRGVFLLTVVQGVVRASRPLGFEMGPESLGRNRDHEARPLRGQNGLGRVAVPAGELDQAMADEGRLANQDIPAKPMPSMPLSDRGAGPASDRQPDHGVGHARFLRVSPAWLGSLEHGPGHVPLQEVDGPSVRVREMRELVDQETLSGSGKAREEDELRLSGQRRQGFKERRVRIQDEAAWLDGHGGMIPASSLSIGARHMVPGVVAE